MAAQQTSSELPAGAPAILVVASSDQQLETCGQEVLAASCQKDNVPDEGLAAAAADADDADDDDNDDEAVEASSLLGRGGGEGVPLRRVPGPFPIPTSASLELDALPAPAAPPAREALKTPTLSVVKTDGSAAAPAAAVNHPARQQVRPCLGRGFLGPLGRVAFCVQESPDMTQSGQVRYLKPFRLGDTYKLKTRSWLIPQFLSGALTLTGVVLTLVGIISLQINKYLHACDAEDGIDCKSNKDSINNVMMPIGVGTTGGGLTLILISGFVFLHAFCVIYDDVDNEDDGTHEAVLHIPVSARAALLGSTMELSPEALARCQSYYDNLQDYVTVA